MEHIPKLRSNSKSVQERSEWTLRIHSNHARHTETHVCPTQAQHCLYWCVMAESFNCFTMWLSPAHIPSNVIVTSAHVKPECLQTPYFPRTSGEFNQRPIDTTDNIHRKVSYPIVMTHSSTPPSSMFHRENCLKKKTDTAYLAYSFIYWQL